MAGWFLAIKKGDEDMSTRQYIGARYVPKFFDWDGSPEWRSGVAYEALTIVTRNGNSYTSKIPVPSNIGAPESNPTYWVATGLYNEQIESIRQLTQGVADNLEDEITNRIASDTALGERITDNANALESETANRIASDTALGERITDNANLIETVRTVSNKNYILLGDSYNADYHYSWGKKFINSHGLTEGENVWNLSVPGAGFGTADPYNFYTGLQNIRNSMTTDQANSITDVVIQGGINDWSSTDENIGDGIINSENFVKQNFPHAKMYIICASWAYALDGEREGAIRAYNDYSLFSRFSAVYHRAYAMFLYPGSLDTDMTHPTDTSTSRLSKLIDNFVNGGNLFYVKYNELITTFNPIIVRGNVTPYGTHIYHTQYSRIDHTSVPITLSRDDTIISTHEGLDSQNLFFRNAVFPGTALINTYDGTTSSYIDIQCVFSVVKRANALTWDLKISNRSIVNGSFNIPNVVGIYPLFDCWLDVTKS